MALVVEFAIVGETLKKRFHNDHGLAPRAGSETRERAKALLETFSRVLDLNLRIPTKEEKQFRS
jgi:hypothetical protein